MKKLILTSLLCSSLVSFAGDLCPLAVGSNWKGTIRLDPFKFHGTGKVVHLADFDYLVQGSVPDLGVRKSYQVTCKNSVVHTQKLKGSVTIKRSGNKLYADHAQDGAKVHFERKLSTIELLKALF